MTSKYNWTTCVWEQQKLRVGWSKALESDWTHTDWYVSLHSRAYLSSHKSSPSLACLFLNNYTERFYGLASSLHLLLTIDFGPMQLSVMKMLFCWKLCSPTCVNGLWTRTIQSEKLWNIGIQYNSNIMRPRSVVSATKAFVSDKIYHIFFQKRWLTLLAKK